jgi:hypothetical protein
MLARQTLYHLNHSASPLGILREGLGNYFPRLVLNLDPPDLCLLNS